MSAWPALPVFMGVAGRPVILLGDGPAADAKRRLLERAGAVVTGDGDAPAGLAIVALDDAADAASAADRLRARGILVNVVDRPELCDFTLPAIVDRAPLLVAIGTGGVSAGLAAAVRQQLERVLPAGLGMVARRLHAARGELRARYPDAAGRRRVIAAALGPGGAIDDPARADAPDWPFAPDGAETGTVAILLTSNDPDDLTLRQARLLANADRVVHAPDVPAAILDRARADADRIAGTADAGYDGLTVSLAMAR